ncbi:MAG: HIT family protein [bacterium]
MARDENCIFCKIAGGEIPAEVVWENETHMAFLDIFPLRKAQTVVIPKDHIPSSLYAMQDEDYSALMTAAKRTAEQIEKSLGAERTMVVGEGLEIDHAHLKLYPRFEGEHGLVKGGPGADPQALKELGRIIRGE